MKDTRARPGLALIPNAPTPQRSAVMRAVRARDTGPERRVRALLRKIAPGYRLQHRGLPGTPDVAYIGRRLTIFVHGCFWHGHDCPRGARAPKTNAEYWSSKIARNVARDARIGAELEARGWRVLIVWECELKNPERLEGRLRAALEKGL
jgi:DNA mismatch endonuclease (patch repair protein)